MKKLALLLNLAIFMCAAKFSAGQTRTTATLETDNTWTGIQTFSVAPVFSVTPTFSGLTNCSVLFASSGALAQDNSNFCYTSHRLGIGTSTPVAALEVTPQAIAAAVAVRFKGNVTAAADVLEIYDSQASPALQSYFNSSGAFNTAKQITSTLTTGTAPFSIASTTLVANLNVAALNGIASSSFARLDAGTTYSGTTTQNFGASGITLVLPMKSDPGSPTTGEIWLNGLQVKYRDVTGPTTRTFVDLSNTQTLTNKTLTAPVITVPTIASFVNATHSHQNAAGGGALSAAAITSGILGAANGGTGIAYALFAGPTVLRTYTLPDADATILTTTSLVGSTYGGTGSALNAAAAGRSIKSNGATPAVFVATSVAPGGSGAACSASNWVNAVNADAAPTCAQPASTDLSNSASVVLTTGVQTLTGAKTFSAQVTSTLATGTSPFAVASTTNVANLNASSLSGATFAAPGAIGGGTPAAAAFTTISATGQVTSTLSTGTAPFVIASTTPVANLSATPTTYNTAGTQQPGMHLVKGHCTLGTDCGITLSGSAVFTSSTSYECAVTDETSAAAAKFAPASGSAFTLTGTGTDVLSFLCAGN